MSKNKKMLLAIAAGAGMIALFGAGYLIGNQSGTRFSKAENHRIAPAEKTEPFHDPFFAGGWAPRDPFQEIARIQQAMNRALDTSFSQSAFSVSPGFAGYDSYGYQPSLDIREKPDAYWVYLDMPGIDKNAVDIKIQEHVIIISGERITENKSEDDQQGYYRYERKSGAFMRAIPLPEDASRSGIEAKMDHGVLTLKIPKKAASKQADALTVSIK